MTSPRARDDSADPGKEWAALPPVSTRPPPLPASDWSRRRFAAVMIATALAFPFYEYAVGRWLANRELRTGMEALRETMTHPAPTTEAEPRFASAEEIATRQQQEAARLEALRWQRQSSVRVSGAIDGHVPIAIVAGIPPGGAAEAAERICAQTATRLGRSLRGLTLRVQRDRGPEPATDAGVVVCE